MGNVPERSKNRCATGVQQVCNRCASSNNKNNKKLKEGLESESNMNSVRELITEWKSLNECENLEMKSLYLKKFADQ